MEWEYCYRRDDWPSGFNGLGLFALLRAGMNPFADAFDVNFLISEVESSVGAQVMDIPLVTAGAKNYVSGVPFDPTVIKKEADMFGW